MDPHNGLGRSGTGPNKPDPYVEAVFYCLLLVFLIVGMAKGCNPQ